MSDRGWNPNLYEVDMACIEGERLKSEVLTRIEEYLQAEETQRRSLERFGDTSLIVAEHAYESLSEARRRYWAHVKQHQCEEAICIHEHSQELARVAV